MIFNSLDFAIFFAVVYGLYLLLPHRGQNFLLLVASYTFYGFWDWRFLGLLLLSTVVDFVLAQMIEGEPTQRRRRRLLTISMVVSLTILGFFKYFNFFTDSLAQLLQSFGWNVEAAHLNVILPWGISFYTFQTMNYTIDVYRGHLKASRRFWEFAVFVSFFPHLVAGPIMRASVLLPQVQNPRRITWLQLRDGAWLFFWDLFTKVVIADNLAAVVDVQFNPSASHNLGSVLLGVYCFAFQIYCDFSGYSNMARGISKFMGFELMVNFNNPYFALNPSDFWRRWHISLSTWLRDYLYIPLGGSRKSPVRTYINLTITMLLGGLWHGANWTFVIWGAFHGLFLAVHRKIAGEERKRVRHPLWLRIVFMIGTFHAVCIGWLLFRAQSWGQVVAMTKQAVQQPVLDGTFWSGMAMLACLCAPLWIMECLQEWKKDQLVIFRMSLLPRALCYAVLLLMLVVLGNTGSLAFIYFQF